MVSAPIGFSLSQLYTTASYQSHDLSQIDFEYQDFSGGNFVGQNLVGAQFFGAKLAGADFSHANLAGVQFDSGVYVGAPTSVVSNVKFVGANLAGTSFTDTDVSTVDFTGAIVKDAGFNRGIPGSTVTGGGGPDIVKDGVGGLTVAQLYSTASYQNHDLGAIGLAYNSLAGVNLAGQNLAGAFFEGAVLNGANFVHANLLRSYLGRAQIHGADFSFADMRTSNSSALDFSDVTTTNTIFPNGHINGLDLASGQSLVIHADHTVIYGPPGGPLGPLDATIIIPAIPVVIDQHANTSSGGVLTLLLDAMPWESVVSFQSGIPVMLGGTLDLEFTSDTDVGRKSDEKSTCSIGAAFRRWAHSPSAGRTLGMPHSFTRLAMSP